MKTILLIEDNKIMRENTTEILQLSNYKVMTADNSQAGIEMAEMNHPDLIIYDVATAGADYLEFFHNPGPYSCIRNTPFIIFTESEKKLNGDQLKAAGRKEYLVKPFRGEELLKMVKKYLRNIS